MIEVRREIASALLAGRGVVALETAVLTHGLARPTNVEAMARMIGAVEAASCVPCVCGVVEGRAIAGLSSDEIASMGASDDAVKLSSRDLGWAAAKRVPFGGLTVAGTLHVCAHAGIRVFATGGIGGVHRGWAERPDVSADLLMLSRTACCVVCSGPKSLLDVAATVEALESLGVVTLGYRTGLMPQFYSRGVSGVPVAARAESADEVAAVLRAQWSVGGPGGGVVVGNPIPEPFALEHAALESRIAEAVGAARAAGVRGPEVTPFVLAAIAEATQGRSVEANLTLLEANARLAGEIASAYSAAVAGR